MRTTHRRLGLAGLTARARVIARRAPGLRWRLLLLPGPQWRLTPTQERPGCLPVRLQPALGRLLAQRVGAATPRTLPGWADVAAATPLDICPRRT